MLNAAGKELLLRIHDFRRVERVLERDEVLAGLEGVEDLLLLAELLVAVAGGLDGQADAVIFYARMRGTREVRCRGSATPMCSVQERAEWFGCRR